MAKLFRFLTYIKMRKILDFLEVAKKPDGQVSRFYFLNEYSIRLIIITDRFKKTKPTIRIKHLASISFKLLLDHMTQHAGPSLFGLTENMQVSIYSYNLNFLLLIFIILERLL